MNQLVYFFAELGTEYQHFAGGKGGTLAQLYKKRYPVPNGFIIMPSAFENNELIPEAWAYVRKRTEGIWLYPHIHLLFMVASIRFSGLQILTGDMIFITLLILP